jgi:hypothetical protein
VVVGVDGAAEEKGADHKHSHGLVGKLKGKVGL